MFDIHELEGKVLKEIDFKTNNLNDEITFKTNDDRVFKLYHSQECCESVVINNIKGELDDLLGSPILKVEKWINKRDNETWTLYKLETETSIVEITWLGESNGYYSESVDFCEVTKPKGKIPEIQENSNIISVGGEPQIEWDGKPYFKTRQELFDYMKLNCTGVFIGGSG